ncbi:MAG: PHP domain-containing protein [Candidatus Woesearchaeota archaeon]|nr:PHP domain-containing protein [Candidatus Woesearchaeota archaeon]
MRIVNPGREDGHIHSLNFSDGLNTIDEIVQYAGVLGLKKIAITDHSQATLDHYGVAKKTFRKLVDRWKNVFNKVEVAFGVEADLLNRDGDVCFDIDGVDSDFVILSAHNDVFQNKPKRITQAYVNAIKRYHERIDCIGHPDFKYFAKDVDIGQVTGAANDHGIPMEFNTGNFVRGYSDLRVLEKILARSRMVMVNSDAHNLYELKYNRKAGFKYLKEHKFWVPEH